MRLITTLILVATVLVARAQQPDTAPRILIVIFDGLRPEYITPELMPNVSALKKKGSYANANHSVFPTVTRVNASSYATGSYPGTHGLLGNTVYFPEVDNTHGLNTGDASVLMQISEATNGKLLTAVSLGEVLQKAGSKMMVFSSGSSGQAFLQNHKVGDGAVVHPELILPAFLKEGVYKNIGVPPPSGKPNTAQHDWAARAFLHYATQNNAPQVSAIWFSDPDGAAHDDGIGSASAMESIRIVDGRFGFIIETLESKGLLDRYNIIISADHGFVTHKGKVGIQQFLIKEGLKQNATSDDVVIAGSAVYVKDHNAEKIKSIVATLQQQPWVGAIFTKAQKTGSAKGWVEGTLSFESIHWDHQRAGDILVDYNWDDEANSNGYRGSSFAGGVAGHGGSSPYEIHIPMIAFGPAFKKDYQSSVPVSNTDIVPTVLQILKLAVPASMDGRVMDELLLNTPPRREQRVRKEILEATVQHPWGTYHVTLHRSIVGKQQYVDFTQVERRQTK